MREFLKDLLGYGRRGFAPIVVAAARTGAAAGVTAFTGALLTSLSVFDWGQYAVMSPVIMGGIRWLGEGLADQLKPDA